jgi:hypothetical protein
MKANPLLVGIIGAIIGFMLAVFFYPSKNMSSDIELESKIDSTVAQTLFDNYWAYNAPNIDTPPNVKMAFAKLDSIEQGHLNNHFKHKYRLTNLTLDEEMLKMINKAYKKLKKPDFLKLYMGDAKPETPQFGFIAVGYDTTQIKHMGAVPPQGVNSAGYTSEMYYLEGSESPTCPYECDSKWPIGKPPTH